MAEERRGIPAVRLARSVIVRAAAEQRGIVGRILSTKVGVCAAEVQGGSYEDEEG
jgi:hypothetical protein